MADLTSLLARVRNQLGDRGQSFQVNFVADGEQTLYDMGYSPVGATSITVRTLVGGTLATLRLGTDFTVDEVNGMLTLANPVTNEGNIIVTGSSYSLFTDLELTQWVTDAVSQHTHGMNTSERFSQGTVGQQPAVVLNWNGAANQDPWAGWTAQSHSEPPVNLVTAYGATPAPYPAGVIRYAVDAVGLNNLPDIEEPLVALLATIEALWALSTDASTDVDIQTAEGTVVPRGQRYRQILQQIDMLTEKYRSVCAQLNVGLYRIEVSNLRRVSRTTNRLIPVYVEREYDDADLPVRQIVPIDGEFLDDSGIPSPAYFTGLG